MEELNLNALLDREEIEKEFINSLTYFKQISKFTQKRLYGVWCRENSFVKECLKN